MSNMNLCRITLLPLIVQLATGAFAQQPIPRSTPETEGISSASISRFVDATSKSKTEFHSFMLLRHVKVIAEGWWNPYRAGLEHSLYSGSKSFTVTAIGFAISEKLLSLDYKVISFFPNDLPDTVSKWLAEFNVKDVLMMSDGLEPDPSFAVAFPVDAR